jgi:LmbE family N-acetylglucosaminyl deacetylase
VSTPRALVVVAHPDDETFGLGSVIASLVDDGAEVTVCCATRGELGESHIPLAEGQSLADVREAELRAAGELLGVSRFVLLGFVDSGMEGEPAPESLCGAPLDQVVAAVRAVVDEVRPSVVVSTDTVDGHRDHERIGVAMLAAVADRPEVTAYVWSISRPLLEQWFAHLAGVRPDAPHLRDVPVALGRPPEEVTTVLDTRRFLDLRRRAGEAHASQMPPFAGMPPHLEEAFLTADHLVRIQPPWPGGEKETRLSC